MRHDIVIGVGVSVLVVAAGVVAAWVAESVVAILCVCVESR